MAIICAGAIEYSAGRRLDETPCTYVRFRLLVEGVRGDQLWTEEEGASVAECLGANEIVTHGIEGPAARIRVAATNLADFEDWSPGMSSLCLRTFLNVLGPDGKSIFGADDCWDTIIISGKPLNHWYTLLAAIAAV